MQSTFISDELSDRQTYRHVLGTVVKTLYRFALFDVRYTFIIMHDIMIIIYSPTSLVSPKNPSRSTRKVQATGMRFLIQHHTVILFQTVTSSSSRPTLRYRCIERFRDHQTKTQGSRTPTLKVFVSFVNAAQLVVCRPHGRKKKTR